MELKPSVIFMYIFYTRPPLYICSGSVSGCARRLSGPSASIGGLREKRWAIDHAGRACIVWVGSGSGEKPMEAAAEFTALVEQVRGEGCDQKAA